MPRRALILGGGWAGCAAAWHFARRGFKVLLCEASPRLGGRATSFSGEGDWELDNGQHLFSAAYTTSLSLLRDLGTADAIHFQPRLRVPFFLKSGEVKTLQATRLPGPLALFGGLAEFDLLDAASRRQLKLLGLRTGLDMAAALLGGSTRSLQTLSVEQWLRGAGQSKNALRLFWEPLCLAVLNAPMQKAQALGLAQTLAASFLRGGKRSGLGFSSRPLSSLLDPALAKWLQTRGGEIRCGTQAVALEFENGRAKKVRLSDGTQLEAEVFVVAMMPDQALRLFDQEWHHRLGLAQLEKIENSPIVAVHLWTGQVLSEEVFGAFSPGEGEAQPDFHWMFYKDLICAEHPWQGSLYSFVASASLEMATLDKKTLEEKLFKQLKQWFPHFDKSQVLRTQVLREKKATPLFVPGSEGLRRDPAEALPNLAFAGDWTQGGLPATIEGAARSGVAAARRLGA